MPRYKLQLVVAPNRPSPCMGLQANGEVVVVVALAYYYNFSWVLRWPLHSWIGRTRKGDESRNLEVVVTDVKNLPDQKPKGV